MLEGTEAEAQALREEVAALTAAAGEKDQALSTLQVAKAQLESNLDEASEVSLSVSPAVGWVGLPVLYHVSEACQAQSLPFFLEFFSPK